MRRTLLCSLQHAAAFSTPLSTPRLESSTPPASGSWREEAAAAARTVVAVGAGAAVHPVPRHDRVELLAGLGRALRRALSRGGAAVVLAATAAAEAGQRRVCGHPAC